MDWLCKQRVQGDVGRRELGNKQTGWKGPHLQHIHICAERRAHGGSSCTLCRESAQMGAPLMCLCSNTCSIGSKQEELEVSLQLQGYGLTAVTEEW